MYRFVIARYVDHRDLHVLTHSFPTRRSSDLAREDGQWDLEAELIDTKAYDFPKQAGTHYAGQPIHHMHLRITIDEEFSITAAVAAYDAADRKSTRLKSSH